MPTMDEDYEPENGALKVKEPTPYKAISHTCSTPTNSLRWTIPSPCPSSTFLALPSVPVNERCTCRVTKLQRVSKNSNNASYVTMTLYVVLEPSFSLMASTKMTTESNTNIGPILDETNEESRKLFGIF